MATFPNSGVIEININAAKTEVHKTQNAGNRRRSGVAARDPPAAAIEENEIRRPINVAGMPTYFSNQTI